MFYSYVTAHTLQLDLPDSRIILELYAQGRNQVNHIKFDAWGNQQWKKKLEINGDTKAQEEKWFPLLTFNFLIMIFFDSNKLPTLTFLLFH